MNALRHVSRLQQRRTSPSREQLGRMRVVELLARCAFSCGGYGCLIAKCQRLIEHRRQVIRQHLGRHIHQQRMLAQPAHALQPQGGVSGV